MEYLHKYENLRPNDQNVNLNIHMSAHRPDIFLVMLKGQDVWVAQYEDDGPGEDTWRWLKTQDSWYLF